MKKFIALLLALCMIFATVTASASALDLSGLTDSENAVARIYLCSNWSGFPSLGHVWVYFENLSGSTIEVGAYDLAPGAGVSVGSFGLTRSDGAGVYYNIESYCGNLYGMTSFIHVSTTVSASEMKAISAFISGYNVWDPVIFNCVFFAATCWDMAGGSFVMPVSVLPVIGRLQIALKGASSAQIMGCPSRSQVYKQVGIGSFATLQTVSDGSVDTVPG